MRRLLTGYAVSFNLRHKRHGQLFQNRYKSIICQEDAYLKELVRYIHLNPLRAKMVKDFSSLKQYAFSGHRLIDPDEIFQKGRQRTSADARGLFCYWCSCELSLSLTELARKLEMTISGIGYAVRRGEALAKRYDYRLIK